jgi:Flp pilus assembly pilin Flp
MLKLYVWLKDLLQSERGQDMVEYALITVLISVGIVLAVVFAGIQDSFATWADGIAGCISDSYGGNCPFA